MRRLWAFPAICLVLLFAGIAPSRAQAAEPCSAKQNTRDLDECYAGEYHRADAALNQLYRQLMAKLSNPSEQALLKSAQEAWGNFRDKECEFETAGTRDGTIHPIEVSVCLTDKTNARIAELKAQLTCPEGDLTCVHERK